MFLRSLGSISFYLLCALSHAQGSCTLSITGQVLDEHDGSALDHAEVRVVELGLFVYADEAGRFRLEGLCAGSYTLRAAHLDCEPVEVRVVVPSTAEVRIRMEHHHVQLKEVEVARQRPDENVGQAHEEVDRSAMEQSSGRTLAEMLSTISGVNMLQSGPTITKPVIHGLSGNRVLTLNQGIRQEDQQWGTEHAPNLDPFSSDRLIVVKGAASVQYGSDALGGVVITEPVDLPREAGITGEVRGIGLLNGRGAGGNGSLQGGLKGMRGLGWRVQGGARAIGDSEASAYVLSNTGLRENGVSATMGYRDHRWNATVYYSYFQRELGILRASHIGNLTDLNNAIASGEPWYIGDFTYDIAPPRQEVQHHLLKAEAGYAISERDRLVLTYGYQADDRQEYDLRRGERSDFPAVDLFLTTHTGDAVLKHWIGKSIHGKVGISGILQENANIPGTGIRPLIPNYRKESGGVFLLEHVPLSAKVELEAGVRLESTRLNVAKYTLDDVLITPRHDFTNSALSVGAYWVLRDSVRLRFNASTAFRPPHVSELYSEGLHHGAAAIENGNDGLRSERALKVTADMEAVWLRGRLRTGVTVYMSRINDFIYLRPAGVQLTIRGAFPVFQYVATDALLHGIDATLQYHFTAQWSIRSRSSLVRGRDVLRNEWLFQMPGDRTENTVLFTLPKAGKWSAVELGGSSTVAFSRSRIPAGLDFAAPPDTYHLIGLSANATRAFGKGELRIGLQAINLFNASYRDYMDRFRYYADARGMDLTIWLRYGFGKVK